METDIRWARQSGAVTAPAARQPGWPTASSAARWRPRGRAAPPPVAAGAPECCPACGSRPAACAPARTHGARRAVRRRQPDPTAPPARAQPSAAAQAHAWLKSVRASLTEGRQRMQARLARKSGGGGPPLSKSRLGEVGGEGGGALRRSAQQQLVPLVHGPHQSDALGCRLRGERAGRQAEGM